MSRYMLWDFCVLVGECNLMFRPNSCVKIAKYLVGLLRNMLPNILPQGCDQGAILSVPIESVCFAFKA